MLSIVRADVHDASAITEIKMAAYNQEVYIFGEKWRSAWL